MSITACKPRVSYFEAAVGYGELTPAWTIPAIFYTRTKRLGEQ